MGGNTLEMICPNDDTRMVVIENAETVSFRGREITVRTEFFKCPECGLEAQNIPQKARIQELVADKYREEEGLLTSKQIRECRSKFGLTQAELAEKVGVGIASIKRWENGVVQNKSMDQLLRKRLFEFSFDSEETNCSRIISGDRLFSLERTKLAIKTLESFLQTTESLLKENDPNDKMLIATKYLWYMDFIAYKELGRSITGGSYAALPYGPQLNNYRDLVDQIMRADESLAEPLKKDEFKIIESVAKKFPEPQMVYFAAHEERVCKEKKYGSLIPYTDALQLKGF